MIAIMAAVLATVAIVLIVRMSSLTIGLNNDALNYIGSWEAAYWSGREDGRLQTLRAMADQMSAYEDLPEETRREEFERMLSVVVARNPNFITVYTIFQSSRLNRRSGL